MYHSKLGPSGAHRWIPCPGSVSAEAGLPDTAGPAAEEGTVAHAMAEYTLTQGYETAREYLADVKAQREKGIHDSDYAHDADVQEQAVDYAFTDPVEYVQSIGSEETMADTIAPYIEFVRGLHNPTIETRVHYDKYVPDGSGTSDTFALSPDYRILDVVDLKYGYGRVDAEDNPQGKCYALGVLEDFDFLCEDVEVVRITIVQPRLNAVSTWETTPAAIYEWAETVLAPAADATEAEDAPRVPGPAQCKFCKALATCPAAARFAVEQAVSGFDSDDPAEEQFPRDPKALRPSQIGYALQCLPLLKAWATAITEYAENRAVAGDTIPGFVLGTGRGSYSWNDEEEALKKLTRRIKVDNAAPRALLSPAQAKDAVKAQGLDPDKVLKGMIKHTPGKPKLKPDTADVDAVNLTEGF